MTIIDTEVHHKKKFIEIDRVDCPLGSLALGLSRPVDGGRIEWDKAYYNYDGSGQGVRKVVVKSGQRTERLYLGGVERYREYSVGGTVQLERWTVQIDAIVQVDTLMVNNGSPVTSPVPLIRYQYRDHLGSATMETNETGQVISYEDERTIFATQNKGLVDL